MMMTRFALGLISALMIASTVVAAPVWSRSSDAQDAKRLIRVKRFSTSEKMLLSNLRYEELKQALDFDPNSTIWSDATAKLNELMILLADSAALNKAGKSYKEKVKQSYANLIALKSDLIEQILKEIPTSYDKYDKMKSNLDKVKVDNLAAELTDWKKDHSKLDAFDDKVEYLVKIQSVISKLNAVLNPGCTWGRIKKKGWGLAVNRYTCVSALALAYLHFSKDNTEFVVGNVLNYFDKQKKLIQSHAPKPYHQMEWPPSTESGPVGTTSESTNGDGASSDGLLSLNWMVIAVMVVVAISVYLWIKAKDELTSETTATAASSSKAAEKTATASKVAEVQTDEQQVEAEQSKQKSEQTEQPKASKTKSNKKAKSKVVSSKVASKSSKDKNSKNKSSKKKSSKPKRVEPKVQEKTDQSAATEASSSEVVAIKKKSPKAEMF